MLSTTKVDIAFLVDESRSEEMTATHEWLSAIVDELHNTLTANGNDFDVRYGLIGFGEDTLTAERHAHSQLVNPNTSLSQNERLFTIQQSELATAIDSNLAQSGGFEDGWDALEHAIAEANFVTEAEHAAGAAYGFREGAVPIFVLVQNEEGRANLNTTLTRDGVLAALRSKNVILNSLVVGPNIGNDSNQFMEPLFDLAPYGLSGEIRVLGVEADVADGASDGQHNYHAFNTVTNTVPSTLPTTQANALQISYNGSNTGASGMVASGKSVLIGQHISGGIGQTAAGYRAKEVPFVMENFGGGASVPLGPNGSLNYSFTFFGTTYSRLWVNHDGTITFPETPTGQMNDDPGGSNVDLSQAGTGGPERAMIAALWDELEIAAIQTRLKDLDFEGVNNDLVIQWSNNRYAGDMFPYDQITFQAVLFSDGKIRLSYQDIDSVAAHNSSGNPIADATFNETGGISATVGIWSGTADTITLEAGKLVPGPHIINGSTLNFDGSGDARDTNNSYVRLAWDTGGAAWDVGVIEEFFGSGGINSPEANALRDAFITSLAAQIHTASTLGKVVRADDPLVSIDYGVISGPGANGFTADYTTPGVTPTTQSIDLTSNSIPAVGTPAGMEDVFQTARTGGIAAPDINLSFTTASYPTLTDGAYIVELFFAEISTNVDAPGESVFDVLLEGKVVLNNYDIFDDRARIVEFGTSTTELDVSDIGGTATVNPGGVVKRFHVNVSNADGAAGLQVRLDAESGLPMINALRILRADPPRVENVVLRSFYDWENGVDYSYAEAVFDGKQLAPMYREGADRIEIFFDGPVDLANATLTLVGSDGVEIVETIQQKVGFDARANMGIWNVVPPGASLPGPPLAAGKYAFKLTGVKGSGGLELDGDWTNDFGPGESHDDFGDDPDGRRLLSGDGASDDLFEFFFSVLPGDYDQNGIIDTNDVQSGTVKDGDGDGDVDAADTAIATAIIDTPTLNDNALITSRMKGDYNDDERVETDDYCVWRVTFGETAPRANGWWADGNDNGIVDAADYSLWQNNQGGQSAWYAGSMGSGNAAQIPVVIFGEPPRVANVKISGSDSLHTPYSFDTVDGSGMQLKTVPVGDADTVTVTFTEDVNIVASDFHIVGLYSGHRPTVVEFSYDMATMTATWRMSDAFGPDQYAIVIDDTVTDVEGNPLDGEWTNPRTVSTVHVDVSEFPSGDGEAGGDFAFVFTPIPGDANRDGVVNSSDFDAFYSTYGMSGPSVDWSYCDMDGDQDVDYSDWYIIEGNLGIDRQTLDILADLNGDFAVDELDMEIFGDNVGMSSPTQADGDLNGDGQLDTYDLDLMFAQYGLELAVAG